MYSKKLTSILCSLLIIGLFSTGAKSADECFEGLSRSVFKFNMVLDDIVLEPIAKGYNKLLSPLRTGTSNFTSNVSTLLSIPNFIGETSTKLVTLQEVS